jgi:hypothetical protein
MLHDMSDALLRQFILLFHSWIGVSLSSAWSKGSIWLWLIVLRIFPDSSAADCFYGLAWIILCTSCWVYDIRFDRNVFTRLIGAYKISLPVTNDLICLHCSLRCYCVRFFGWGAPLPWIIVCSTKRVGVFWIAIASRGYFWWLSCLLIIFLADIILFHRLDFCVDFAYHNCVVIYI